MSLTLAALVATGAAGSSEACALLDDADVRTAQGVAPEQRVPSEQPGRAFRLVQCYFRTADMSRSVSLALARPAASRPAGAREFWRDRFHGEKAAALRAGVKKEKPPRPVDGLGDEAFWVGDPRTGSLYVLRGDTFLRISVGGTGTEDAKVERARTLAASALKRLAARSEP